MSRDFLSVNDVIVCIDNSVSVGTLDLDEVQVSYEVAGYYAARVVLIEMLASGGKPVCYTLGNGTNDGYKKIHTGITRLFAELGLTLPHISSSESNFEVKQSSVCITLIGKKIKEFEEQDGEYALIGEPLVGEEVVSGNSAKLRDIYELVHDSRIVSLLPVGSKGVQEEALDIYGVKLESDEVDMMKSSGPSTSVIIKYNDDSVFEDYPLKKLKVA